MNYYPRTYKALFLIFILGACSSEPWTGKEQADFLSSCQLEGVEDSKCQCMMEETMKRYPRYEESEKISFEEAVEIAELCE